MADDARCGGALALRLAWGCLLALRLHALLERVHDVDDLGGAGLLGDDRGLPMLELGVDQLPHGFGIFVLELLRLERA